MLIPKKVEVKITHECVYCKKEKSIIIPMNDYITYLRGEENVQDIFPEMSADDREFFFISGICPDCWGRIFAEPSSEEEINKIVDELAEMHYEIQGEIERGK